MQPRFVLIMKKKLFWVAVFAAMVFICITVYALQCGMKGNTADIYLGGELYRSVRLDTDCSFRINTARGYNDVRVEDGKIFVTEADCPDKKCVESGACTGALPIVCLPHELVIQIYTKDNNGSFSR